MAQGVVSPCSMACKIWIKEAMPGCSCKFVVV